MQSEHLKLSYSYSKVSPTSVICGIKSIQFSITLKYQHALTCIYLSNCVQPADSILLSHVKFIELIRHSIILNISVMFLLIRLFFQLISCSGVCSSFRTMLWYKFMAFYFSGSQSILYMVSHII